MAPRDQPPRERAARALCRFHGVPENTTFEGRPMWQSYLPEVDAVLTAVGPENRSSKENAMDQDQDIEADHLASFLVFIDNIQSSLGSILTPAEIVWVRQWFNPKRSPAWVAEIVKEARNRCEWAPEP